MEFNIEKFEATSFKDRTESVPVPRLKAFFDKLEEGEQPVWVVRGLTGEESALAKQAVSENKNIEAVLAALNTTVKKDKIEGIKALAGVASDRAPDELVQRYSWLEHGSVEPKCSHEMAMKLALNFPEDFYLLTNKIINLTGKGRLGE